MRRPIVIAGILGLSLASAAFAAARWPTMDKQLQQSRVQPGTPLEKLIQSNQDFSILRPEEANDKIQVPLWLRVYWRKAHPEAHYSATDPTGGYPHVLKEVAEWMMLHQDLVPDQADDPRAPMADDDFDAQEKTTVGTNRRISGSQTVPRSESDIRINFWNTSKIIAASNNIGGSGQQAQYYSSDGGTTWGQSSSACRRAIPSTPTPRSTGPRTAPPGPPPSASTPAAPRSRCAPTSRPTAAPPGSSTTLSRAPRPTPTRS